MRVTGQNGQPVDKLAEKSEIGKLDKLSEAAPAVLGAATAVDAALESSNLQPAKAALAEMPEIDQAKVDMLREALARGEITFDAGRLAKLIQRFHGGRG